MNKKLISLLLFFSLAVYSCDTKKEAATSENNLDAARNFIRAALDGKFNEARTYMLQDSLNNNYLDVAERSYKNTSQDVKDGYMTSSIRFHQPVVAVNDSTTIIVYSNSYKNDPDTLRVLKINSNWLVDLKYLYQHDTDTVSAKTITNDSLK